LRIAVAGRIFRVYRLLCHLVDVLMLSREGLRRSWNYSTAWQK
jgi:hypothetical protein